MRLQIVNSKNATSLYVIKSLRVNGKNTSKVVEKLGTLASLSKTHDDPIAWANSYISELNRKEKEEQREVIVKYNQSKRLAPYEQAFFNGGYLFLHRIYHQLQIHRICKDITCFLALTLFRYLEQKRGGAFTSTEIIHGLRAMNFYNIPGDGYVPVYTRNDFTDALHKAFHFQTDYQVVSTKRMKKIFQETEK